MANSKTNLASDRTFWSAVAVGFLIFNLCAFSLWLLRTFQEERVARTRSAITAAHPSTGAGDLRIDAWANASRVTAPDMVQFSISIQNPSATAASSVRFVTFDRGDGLVVPVDGLDAFCWSREAQPKPICTTVDNITTRPATWPLTIPPGGGVTVMTRLKAQDEPGRWYLTAVVAWVDGAHNLSRRKGVSLGPVVVEGAWQKKLLLIGRALQSYLKDLVWPQLAALFGIWVKRQDDRRDQAREKERDSQAAVDRVIQESRAMVQQTWTLMLPISHQNNTKFYMPISHAVGQIHKLYSKIGKEPFAAEECFYFIWRLHKIMDRFITKVGGWYLKNRRGEEILAVAWRTIIEWIDSIIMENQKSRAARAIREDALAALPEERISFSRFQKQVAPSPPFPKLSIWFQRELVLQSAANIMAVFELVEMVIDYEINRPYVYWYGGENQMVEFDLEAYDEVTQRFNDTRPRKVPYDKKLDELATEISRYREEILKSQPSANTSGNRPGSC